VVDSLKIYFSRLIKKGGKNMLVRKASIMILLLSLFTLSNAQEIILKPEIEKR
jgi:hypothetical protein